MKAAVVMVGLVCAGTAAADPCQVTIVRVPEEARATIEGWVAQETNCKTKLEVRVIATTEGGLYIIARDDRGRLHERVVPTAESAGVLIASWAADDSIAGPTKPDPADTLKAIEEADADDIEPRVIETEPARPPEPERQTNTSAPGEVLVEERVDRGERQPRDTRNDRQLTAGLQIGMSGGGGVGARFEYDAKRIGPWVLGGAFGVAESTVNSYMGSTFDTLDVKAAGYVARIAQSGSWQLRAGAGVGFAFTSAVQIDHFNEASGFAPFGELDVRVTRSFGGGWGLGFGPIVTVYAQRFRTVDAYGNDTTEQRELEVVGLATIQHRL